MSDFDKVFDLLSRLVNEADGMVEIELTIKHPALDSNEKRVLQITSKKRNVSGVGGLSDTIAMLLVRPHLLRLQKWEMDYVDAHMGDPSIASRVLI